jgi:hypothetical protein
MLQLEEDKALKKIEETRRKAKNILELRLNKKSRKHSRGEDGERPISPRDLSLSNRPLTPEENRTSVFFDRKHEH